MEERVRNETRYEQRPLVTSGSARLDSFIWPILRDKGILLQASETVKSLGRQLDPILLLKILLTVFSFIIVDLFIFLINLSVINKLSYCGRIKHLNFR